MQCLHIFFWTLQYLLFTRLLKNHSGLGAHFRTWVHVLQQHFHLLWLRNPLDLSRTSVCWFSKLILHLLEKAGVYICTCRFQATCWALYRKSAVFPPAFGAPMQGAAATGAATGSPDTAWDNPPPLPAAQDLVSSAWGCPINSLFFSHRLAQRNCEDGPTSSSYPIQNICLHKYFLGACRVSKSPARTLENSTDAGYLELTGDRNAKTLFFFFNINHAYHWYDSAQAEQLLPFVAGNK